MSTSPWYIEFLKDCFSPVSGVFFRAMFGEYAYYKDGKVVGLICDDTCYIKITPSSDEILWEDRQKGSPYPWAKPQYILPEEILENRELLQELIIKVAEELPAPKIKKPKK